MKYKPHTTSHLVPSSSVLGGFFETALGARTRAAGLAGTAGTFLEDESGTVLPARNDGFLCVICEGSTLRSPEVTAPPLFKSARRAAAGDGPDAAGVGASVAGGGGGGGGGGPPADGAGAALVPADGMELGAAGPFGFHVTPVVCHCLTYFCNASSRTVVERAQATCLVSLKRCQIVESCAT